ncbi:unnamed protein product [Mytilus coruscus]|uniref:Caspase recruitment domain-containing protein n=1 Tax=Mytilus coruscus TaxID=42192 RepID=A0A6J8CAB8_MYTCO|nr:unnamed protein product [Mytilus coruscus]
MEIHKPYIASNHPSDIFNHNYFFINRVHRYSNTGKFQQKYNSKVLEKNKKINEHMSMAESQTELLKRVFLLESEFLKFLKPTDVVFNIQGLEEDFIDEIWELEKNNRKEASDRLLKKISENCDLLPKFIVALSDQGYQRFVDPINNIYPDRGRKFCQEYFEFLINYMKGELADILEPLQICAYLYRNRCIELSDKEAIKAMQSSRGRTAACQEMFQAVKRRKDNWALLLLEAIKETQEYVKLKMDPSASQEELERTGILLAGTKQRYHSDSTSSDKESVKFKSYFQFDVNLRQKFQLQPIKYSDIRDVIITNDQLVFADYARNSLLIYDINGSYNREIKLSSNPLSISVINENDVAVSYYRGRRIEIISINTGKVKTKIGTSGNTGGISYQNGLIYAVVDDQNIDVMNMTGKLIRSFEGPLKSMERCLSTNTDSLFFTDSFNAILYCCNLNGSYRWKFTYDKMPILTEVTTDRDGNVYLACYDSNNVIVVSSDGKYRKELLTVKDGLRSPTGIYYDNSNDCLLVCNEGDSVTPIKIIFHGVEERDDKVELINSLKIELSSDNIIIKGAEKNSELDHDFFENEGEGPSIFGDDDSFVLHVGIKNKSFASNQRLEQVFTQFFDNIAEKENGQQFLGKNTVHAILMPEGNDDIPEYDPVHAALLTLDSDKFVGHEMRLSAEVELFVKENSANKCIVRVGVSFPQAQTPAKLSVWCNVKLRHRFQIDHAGKSLNGCEIINNELVFTDTYNNRLLIYNKDGRYTRDLTLSDAPWFVSGINDKYVAVTYSNSYIDIININTGQLRNIIDTRDKNDKAYGIVYAYGLIYLVINLTEVHVMDHTGGILKLISCPFSRFWHISYYKEMLFLTDFLNDTLYCYDLYGSVSWKFTYKRMRFPLGVTTDEYGNVYVACHGFNTVVVVTLDGKHH